VQPSSRALIRSVRDAGGHAALLGLACLAGAAAELLLPAALGRAVDAVLGIGGVPRTWLIVTMVLIGTAATAEILTDLAGAAGTARATARLRHRLLRRVFAMPYRSAARYPVGDLVARLGGQAACAVPAAVAAVGGLRAAGGGLSPDDRAELLAARQRVIADGGPHESEYRIVRPDGETRTVGVINLIGRSTQGGFSAGDMKLLSAIASQIGAAVENNRLIAESLRQERMVREMELAHDLQLKLLPPLEQFAGYAEVAARCAPAESVGGDFYHLFRLPGNRLGVLIGDVSSHGFGAALIMALTMSAVAIHASEGDPPAEVLARTHRAVIDELETTEMYLTLFYGVIDPAEGTITYANAGHSHAWRVPAAGAPERLQTTDPPFGIVDHDAYGEASARWEAERDLLFLFTDGLSDALKGGEAVLVDEVAKQRAQPADQIIRRLFALAGRAGAAPADDRTAVLVRF